MHLPNRPRTPGVPALPALLALIAALSLLLFAAAGARAADAPPDWARSGGTSPRYPNATFFTGFFVAQGDHALEAAKAGAAADLATRVSVRVEHDFQSQSAEKNGAQSYAAASLTRATADVRLTNLLYETYTDGAKTWALAYKPRSEAAAERKSLRDAALKNAREQLAQSLKAEEQKREADALAAACTARLWTTEAAEQHAVARAIALGAGGGWPAEAETFDAAPVLAQADDRVRALLKRPVSTLDDAVAFLALQLGQQGVNSGRWTAAPLTFGTTSFSSAFGRRIAQELERALAAQPQLDGTKPFGDLALRGTYVEAGEVFRLLLVARDAKTGKAVASAEAALPKKAIPADLPTLPVNFAQALQDQKVLAEGELVAGALDLQVWTNKGRTGLVFAKKEEVTLYLKVNQPAYVRMVYLLATGRKVGLEQSYYIDASKVNQAVEYPNKFGVSPPFGVEQLFAVAFTEKPEPLLTAKETVDGEEYEVVAEGMAAMVKHRGLTKKKAAAQTAEATIALTTTPP